MRVPSLILREHLHRLGWVGAAGALLVLFSLALGVAQVLPAWHNLESARQQVEANRTRLDAIAHGRIAAPKALDAPLDVLRQRLPAQPQATEVIDRLYALAEAQHITLSRGEYALGSDPRSKLSRYQILLPVRGTYPQLRRFLQALIAELPALVLEDIDLQRKRIGDGELSGRIRMTLYLSRS